MKPEPKPLKVVCTACGLDWEAHKGKSAPTLETCIKLLKDELVKARQIAYTTTSGTSNAAFTVPQLRQAS